MEPPLTLVNNLGFSRNRFGSVDRASACGLKGPGFDSGQGHVPWLQVHPCKRQLGGVQEAAGRCLSLIDVSNSLSLSIPLCVKSIKYIFLEREENSA